MNDGLSIYLDDCADDNLLGFLPRNAGHIVITPRTAGTLGWDDQDHLEYAAAYGYVLLTKNPEDFVDLHNEWQVQEREHAGVFLIYQDNIVGKDMARNDIVRAIQNLLIAGIPIANEVHILNQWR